MPKMKTRRAARKRFKITARGKLMHKPTGMGQQRSEKTKKRKRRLSRDTELTGGYARQARKCMPYDSR
ncbi:MAG: 50S ribosomal protein L35 [Armatimonadetes bacterium]|nr:50S ribosomal protein L35 [Armatimonadota bacterium]